MASTIAQLEEKNRMLELEQRLLNIEKERAALIAENGQLKEQATKDPLTKISNMRALEEDISKLEAQYQRESYRQGQGNKGSHLDHISYVMLDLAQFKQYNDTNGQLAGDRLLKGIADVLNIQIRPEDTAYRRGGDEFSILARDVDSEGTKAMIDRIKKDIKSKYGADICIGYANFKESCDSPSELMPKAERAFEMSKAQSRPGSYKVIGYDKDFAQYMDAGNGGSGKMQRRFNAILSGLTASKKAFKGAYVRALNPQ